MRVNISHIGAKGDGIADGPLFVPFSVDGDDLEVKVNGKQGRIKHIHKASPHRVAPLCKHFGRCGGCALQHVSEDHYKNWKQQKVITELGHRGFDDISLLPLEVSPLASRRRARLTAIGGRAVGFAERGSHNIIDITECPVMAPEIVRFIGPLRVFLKGQLAARQKMAIQINLADNGLDIILESSGEPDLDLRMDIAAFAEGQDVARICWRDTKLKKPSPEILCERRKPHVSFAEHQVFLPPGSFLQATKAGEDVLMDFVAKAVEGADKIVDIFAGCGTFTVGLIGRHAVHAVEGDQHMTMALQQSSHQMGKIRNLTTEVRDLFLRPLLPHELNKFDAVIIDPPRAGARDQIQEIALSEVANLVMVSCNPATFARDARTLVDAGFIMGDILPVDQFLYSSHLEIVSTFRR
ncbi:MAG: class I SAM-dependent RNA methyltransferase [Alphaproteobacteria bacterium]|nr:class I SAM-dependent RNA methyltransferase [Alphaproteobacteria bacterium]